MALENFWSTVLFGLAAWIITTPHTSMDDADDSIPPALALICGSLWLSWPTTGAWLIYFLDRALPQKGTTIHLVTVWVGCMAILLGAVYLVLDGVSRIRRRYTAQPEADNAPDQDTE